MQFDKEFKSEFGGLNKNEVSEFIGNTVSNTEVFCTTSVLEAISLVYKLSIGSSVNEEHLKILNKIEVIEDIISDLKKLTSVNRKENK